MDKVSTKTPAAKPIVLQTYSKKMLADTVTPVSIYLSLRDQFPASVLLESTDFRSKENCFSFIGLDPMAGIQVSAGRIQYSYPEGTKETVEVADFQAVSDLFYQFISQFEAPAKLDGHTLNGFFGHTSFDAYQYFDSHRFDPAKRNTDLPDINYQLYRYVIAINHFKDELFMIENAIGPARGFERIEALLQSPQRTTASFQTEGEEHSNLSDEAFKELVRRGKHHCQQGDVFQIVFSRQFQQRFSGDDFNVYRVLRSINPSPYLFYFDQGDYRIFGSSPEAQMVIKDRVASVNPIAGTYRRTGDDETDREQARALAADPKENAEHIMLVDLARNDLGRHATDIRVRELKDIQFFSHVIHLVSKVEGKLSENTSPIRVFGDTFPAGTLSGAPKYRAIQLIDQYENQRRGFYGGAIGYIGFNGDMNQAIVIRSFLSRDQTLYYQAGAGIVVASDEEKELQEVNNKLGALKKALLEAENL